MSQSTSSTPTARSSPGKAQQRATVMKKTKFDGRTDQRFDKERIDSLNRSRESDSPAHETHTSSGFSADGGGLEFYSGACRPSLVLPEVIFLEYSFT